MIETTTQNQKLEFSKIAEQCIKQLELQIDKSFDRINDEIDTLLDIKMAPLNVSTIIYKLPSPQTVKIDIKIKLSNEVCCGRVSNQMDEQSALENSILQPLSYESELLKENEELNKLQWIGYYGEKNFKVGQWIAKWKGDLLNEVGGLYFNDGKKQGQWKEIIENYLEFMKWGHILMIQGKISGELFIMIKRLVGDLMIMELKLEIGQIWMINIILENKQFILVTIKMVKKLVDGIQNKVGRECKNNYINDYKTQSGGGIYDNGVKIGNWVILGDQFKDGNEITECGQYENGKKVAIWEIKWKGNEKIGEGLFDDQAEGESVKIGKWIDLDEEFSLEHQMIYKGEYQNGKKIDRWDICGGGLYDQRGNKTGTWVEIYQGLQIKAIQIGEYQNDNKTGRWDILQKDKANKEFKQIGGGSYNYGVKIGEWIDIERLKNGQQVLWNGDYSHGQRVDRWNFWCVEDENNEFLIKGGGFYKNGVKNGDWVNFNEEFSKEKQLIYDGKYQNDKKIGIWHSFQFDKKNFQQIGARYYDIQGILKVEKNIYLTYQGNLKNGYKVGQWQTLYGSRQIGGGKYDEKGHGKKIGQWKESSVDFPDEIIYIGEYNNDGQKIGRWDIEVWNHEKNQFGKIGDGQYHKMTDSLKIGQWKEFDSKDRSIIYIGEYNNYGQKIGRWDIEVQNDQKKQFEKIGGGSYNNSLKIGKWVFIQKNRFYEGEYNNDKKMGFWKKFDGQSLSRLRSCRFYDLNGIKILKVSSSFMHIGNLRNGNKIGKWQTWLYDNKYIGGGLYNEGGSSIQIGKWTIIDDSNPSYVGEFSKNGKKIGRWDIEIWNHEKNQFEKIGGGSYHKMTDSLKIGQWKEFDSKDRSIIYIGEYNNYGQKIGRWDIEFKKYQQHQFEKIGGGCYDERGIKVGQWIFIEGYTKFEGKFNNDGKKIDLWYLRDSRYEKEARGSYQDDKEHGEWEIKTSSGTEKGCYSNGRKIDKWFLEYYERGSRRQKQIYY
ncbi:unnamed protein product [Paramecium pentaurelia]|uniref:Uncharacterized protein n=1 Tax=Paramecium pentaurelia TaxID=43138 RepID=A0A8S1YDH4_9CILI|nr:unnamed protein product [Paramecium pentaurelia]